MKFNISMPDELYQKVVDTAKENYSSRSAFISTACREYIASLEAKKMLPALEVAIRTAATQKELSEDEKRDIEAFMLLSEAVQKK